MAPDEGTASNDVSRNTGSPKVRGMDGQDRARRTIERAKADHVDAGDDFENDAGRGDTRGESGRARAGRGSPLVCSKVPKRRRFGDYISPPTSNFLRAPLFFFSSSVLLLSFFSASSPATASMDESPPISLLLPLSSSFFFPSPCVSSLQLKPPIYRHS